MSAFSKCVVCTDPETSNNQIFCCSDCEISVHKLCYGIIDECIDPWWCSPCNMNQHEPCCELCLKTGGALKKTTCGKWVHVICALFTVGVKFQNKTLMEPVNISKIPTTNRNKKCMFCSKAHGVSCKCTQTNCDGWLHITCAQKANCLKEVNEKNNKIAFRAYCVEHKPVDDSFRRLSSIFVRESLSAEREQYQLGRESDDCAYDVNDVNDTLDAINTSEINETSDVFDVTREASFSSRASEDNNNTRTVDDTAAVTNGTSNASEASNEASYASIVFEDANQYGAVIDASDQRAVENCADRSKIDQSTSSQRNLQCIRIGTIFHFLFLLYQKKISVMIIRTSGGIIRTCKMNVFHRVQKIMNLKHA